MAAAASGQANPAAEEAEEGADEGGEDGYGEEEEEEGGQQARRKPKRPAAAAAAGAEPQVLPVAARSLASAVAIDKDLYVMMGEHDGDLIRCVVACGAGWSWRVLGGRGAEDRGRGRLGFGGCLPAASTAAGGSGLSVREGRGERSGVSGGRRAGWPRGASR